MFQERHLLTAMYEVPGSDITRVLVTEDVIRKNHPPAFVRDLEAQTSDYEHDTNIDFHTEECDIMKDSSPKVV